MLACMVDSSLRYHRYCNLWTGWLGVFCTELDAISMQQCSLFGVSLNKYGLTGHKVLSVEHLRVNVESLNKQGSSRTGYQHMASCS